ADAPKGGTTGRDGAGVSEVLLRLATGPGGERAHPPDRGGPSPDDGGLITGARAGTAHRRHPDPAGGGAVGGGRCAGASRGSAGTLPPLPGGSRRPQSAAPRARRP